jgi:hypothetical protein
VRRRAASAARARRLSFPAERLLGSLAFLLTDRIAGVACRAGVDRRAAVGGVLGDVRRDVEVAQVVDELVHVVSGTQRETRVNGAPPLPRLPRVR